MADPKPVVARVTRISPEITKGGKEMVREHPGGFTVSFDNGTGGGIASTDRGAVLLEILEDLRKLGSPVYAELDGDSQILRILIPRVVKVASLKDGSSEEISAWFHPSSVQYRLKRTHNDFNEIWNTLRYARETDAPLLITASKERLILDARPLPGDYREPPGPDSGRRTLLSLIGRIKELFSNLWIRFRVCFHAVSEERAAEIFQLCKERSCAPLTVPPPCIPFLYPDDGCWVRAHEMYRIMLESGVVSRKLWIIGDLQVQTPNHPDCEVFWGWHVASLICVRKNGLLGHIFRFSPVELVIDPALFDAPVLKSVWKSVQGDAAAELVNTHGSVYYRWHNDGSTQTDPDYYWTDLVLQEFRQVLKNRSLEEGPPPYVCP